MAFFKFCCGVGVVLLSLSINAASAFAVSLPNNTWVAMQSHGDGGSAYNAEGTPGRRAWFQVSYDTATQEVVLFGGSAQTYMSDLWTYKLSENVWHLRREHPDLTGPCRRDNANMVYDPVRQLHWLFNGAAYDNLQPACSTGFAEGLASAGIWTYSRSTNQWTKVVDAEGILHRSLAPGMAYNPNDQTFLEFGGQATGNNQNTTYIFDPANKLWTLLNPSSRPPGRTNIENALVYDEARRVFVLFGGRLQGGVPTNDTWTFDPSTTNWTNKSPTHSPSVRDLHAMVYDPINRIVILHGGRGSDGSGLADTWVYDTAANTWTQIGVTGSIPRIQHHSMTYDVANQVALLVPGVTTPASATDTYIFRYASGAPTAVPTTPATPNTPAPSTPTPRTSPSAGFTPEHTPTIGAPPSPPPGGRIEIPLRKFVVRSLPPNDGSPGPGGVKHTRMIFNPDDGKLYTMSGDWTGPCTATTPGNCRGNPIGSYRNEIFSYAVSTNSWQRETDYCMYPNVQPGRPDYNAVAYDTRRKMFWMHGGYQQGATPSEACIQHNYVRNEMMWWNPLSKLWEGPQGRTPMSAVSGVGGAQSNTKSAFYDTVTDKLVWPIYTSRAGLLRYAIASNTYSLRTFNLPNNCDDDARLGNVGLAAFDSVARIILLVESKPTSTACPNGYTRLWKINVPCVEAAGNGSIASCIAYENLPANLRAGSTDERVVWDSVNQVLFYPYHGGQVWDVNEFQFSVWTPAAGWPATWTSPGSWETIVDYQAGLQAPTDPPGHCPYPQGAPGSAPCNCTFTDGGCPSGAGGNCCLVRGNQIGFDPIQNVMVMYGGTGPWSSYLYLFRYGNGVATDPPSPPNLL